MSKLIRAFVSVAQLPVCDDGTYASAAGVLYVRAASAWRIVTAADLGGTVISTVTASVTLATLQALANGVTTYNLVLPTLAANTRILGSTYTLTQAFAVTNLYYIDVSYTSDVTPAYASTDGVDEANNVTARVFRSAAPVDFRNLGGVSVWSRLTLYDNAFTALALNTITAGALTVRLFTTTLAGA